MASSTIPFSTQSITILTNQPVTIQYSILVIEIRIVWVVIFVDVIVIIGIIGMDILTIRSTIPTTRGVAPVVGSRAPHNGLADASNPVVLFSFGIRVQEVTRVGGRNLKGMSFAALQVGTFHGRARGQIHHPMRTRRLILAKEELAAF
jgi:hypothetical protein